MVRVENKFSTCARRQSISYSGSRAKMRKEERRGEEREGEREREPLSSAAPLAHSSQGCMTSPSDIKKKEKKDGMQTIERKLWVGCLKPVASSFVSP